MQGITLRQLYSIQSFLGACGNVSKLLWPIKLADKASRAPLRRSLHANNKRSIFYRYLENRDLRDHYEHFDERLQQWGRLPEPKALLEWWIQTGQSPKVQVRHKVSNGTVRRYRPKEIMRVYFPDRGEVLFWNKQRTKSKRYNLARMREAVHDLWKKTVELLGGTPNLDHILGPLLSPLTPLTTQQLP